MKTPAIANIGSYVMLLLVILFVAVIAAELFYWDFGDTSVSDTRRGTKQIESLQKAFTLPPMSKTYAEMVKRPLFVPNRRPPAQFSLNKTDQAIQLAAGQLSRIYRLEGIILAAGNNMVLLKEKATGKFFRLAAGEIIDGIQMQALERDQVTLTRGGHAEILKLKIPLQAASLTMMLPTNQTTTPTSGNSGSSKTGEGKELSLYERRKALRARQAREREAHRNSIQ